MADETKKVMADETMFEMHPGNVRILHLYDERDLHTWMEWAMNIAYAAGFITNDSDRDVKLECEYSTRFEKECVSVYLYGRYKNVDGGYDKEKLLTYAFVFFDDKNNNNNVDYVARLTKDFFIAKKHALKQIVADSNGDKHSAEKKVIHASSMGSIDSVDRLHMWVQMALAFAWASGYFTNPAVKDVELKDCSTSDGPRLVSIMNAVKCKDGDSVPKILARATLGSVAKWDYVSFCTAKAIFCKEKQDILERIAGARGKIDEDGEHGKKSERERYEACLQEMHGFDDAFMKTLTSGAVQDELNKYVDADPSRAHYYVQYSADESDGSLTINFYDESKKFDHMKMRVTVPLGMPQGLSYFAKQAIAGYLTKFWTGETAGPLS